MFSDSTWQIIDHFSILLGYLLAIPIVFSGWELLQQRRRRLKYRREVMTDSGSRPTVLIVDVIKPDSSSIRTQVQKYLSSNFEGVTFFDEAIFVAEFKGEMQHTDMDSFMSMVRKSVGKCVDYGTDKLHVFMRCPLPVAASVGEYLSNFAAPVILHHNQLNKGYENWGPLYR